MEYDCAAVLQIVSAPTIAPGCDNILSASIVITLLVSVGDITQPSLLVRMAVTTSPLASMDEL